MEHVGPALLRTVAKAAAWQLKEWRKMYIIRKRADFMVDPMGGWQSVEVIAAVSSTR